MALSSSLISQLVKTTNDSSSASSASTTVYGTVKYVNNSWYVQPDGSEQLVPVAYTVSLSIGDRVTVSIGDHTAIVTGNLTDQSASSAALENVQTVVTDLGLTVAAANSYLTLLKSTLYISGSDVEVEDAVISIEDGTVTIQGVSITALDSAISVYNSSFEITDGIVTGLKGVDGLTYLTTAELTADHETVANLDATYATITNLNAAIADIESAYIKSATVESLLASYATIENLNATNGYISTLQSDVASITSLLSGNIGTGTLQAIHITGDNVIFDEAVITDAAIVSLTADKITSGTIYTSRVTIQTAEGDASSLFTGSLLQFSDENYVRLQVGKDANGVFNYYACDENGNVIWDALGLTEAGLTGNGAIIKDAAIADDANINESKIDMQSVAERLNEDGSITVDYANIIVNDTTLDYALASVTTAANNAQSAADAVATRTTTLETELSVVQGQISAIVSETGIENLEDGTSIYDLYSKINATVDDITSEVSGIKTFIGDDYSTTQTLSAVINQQVTDSAANILLEVSDTYITTAEAETTYAKSASLALTVDTDENGTAYGKISANAEYIYFSGRQLVIDTDNLTLDADGNAAFSGKVIATSGSIGGWSITSTRIASSATISIGSTEAGMLLINEPSNSKPWIHIQNSDGTGMFYISSTGKMYAKDATVVGSITADTFNVSESINFYYGNSSYATPLIYVGESQTDDPLAGGYVVLCVGSKNNVEATVGTKQFYPQIEIVNPTYCLKSLSVYNGIDVLGGCNINGNAFLFDNLYVYGTSNFDSSITLSAGNTTESILFSTPNIVLRTSGNASSGWNVSFYDNTNSAFLLQVTTSKIMVNKALSCSSSLTVSGSIYPSGNVVCDNAHGLYVYDTSGTARAVAYLNSDNNLVYGNGSTSNDIYIGNVDYTNYMYLRAGSQVISYSHMLVRQSTALSTSNTGRAFQVQSNASNTWADSDSTNAIFVCGCDSTSRYIRSYPTYTRTSSSSANVYITSSGTFARYSSSASRYKNTINYFTNADYASPEGLAKRDYTVEESDYRDDYRVILKFPVVQFHYNVGYMVGEPDYDYDKYITGFIAEDIAALCPACATYTEDGQIEAWNHMEMIPRMVACIQDICTDVTLIDDRVTILEAQLAEAQLEIVNLKKQLQASAA